MFSIVIKHEFLFLNKINNLMNLKSWKEKVFLDYEFNIPHIEPFYTYFMRYTFRLTNSRNEMENYSFGLW